MSPWLIGILDGGSVHCAGEPPMLELPELQALMRSVGALPTFLRIHRQLAHGCSAMAVVLQGAPCAHSPDE